jgi:hypothetical protein
MDQNLDEMAEMPCFVYSDAGPENSIRFRRIDRLQQPSLILPSRSTFPDPAVACPNLLLLF